MKYTVAVCNYNMSNTLEESLRSILNQLDDQYEVLVIDDGSTDGSIDILSRLADEYELLRYRIENNHNIGEARHSAVQHAKGDYVLVQLDADDQYAEGIQDFVRVYHAIEEATDNEFFLKGKSINMAPRRLLLDIPYRSLGYGEDKDLWRRLFAADAIIWLEHEPFCTSIGYERTFKSRVRVTYRITRTQFRSGVTFFSFLRKKGSEMPSLRALAQLLFAPMAYLDAVRTGRYEQPPGYERIETLTESIEAEAATLEELQVQYGFELDKAKLSEVGRRAFFGCSDA